MIHGNATQIENLVSNAAKAKKGGQATREKWERAFWNFHHGRFVHCVDCSLTLPDLDALFPGELAKHWNQRDGVYDDEVPAT